MRYVLQLVVFWHIYKTWVFMPNFHVGCVMWGVIFVQWYTPNMCIVTLAVVPLWWYWERDLAQLLLRSARSELFKSLVLYLKKWSWNGFSSVTLWRTALHIHWQRSSSRYNSLLRRWSWRAIHQWHWGRNTTWSLFRCPGTQNYPTQ